jgi:uncharacterized cupin superfamily protein
MYYNEGEHLMPVVRAATAPTFDLDGFHFIALLAPSRGVSETCVWRLEVEAGAKSEAHWLDHEENFVLLQGNLTFIVAGESIELYAGDALSVPARSMVELINTGGKAELMVCLPVGTHATFADGREVGSPPWAQ